MIGKPEWFSRRKYGGWGIIPKTWQGWVYIAVIIIPFAIFQAVSIWSINTRLIVSGIWFAFLLLDVTHIMLTLPRDEREYKIEAIAERNAAWIMILVIMSGVIYQTMMKSLYQVGAIDYFLIAALAAGLLAKAISNIYLERKAL